MKFKIESPQQLMEVLKIKMGYTSNTRSRNVIKAGKVMVNGKVNKIPSSMLNEGDEVELGKSSGAKKGKRLKEEVELRHKIIFEDENLLVVEKRAGLITKSSNQKFKTLFTDVHYYLRSKNVDTCLMVNGIDKKESGLVVFSKELKYYKEFQENWKSYRKRHYVVMPGGMLEEKGTLEDTFHENDIGLLLPGKGKVTKEVELEYRVMKTNGQFSVIRIEEITQHKNQIRAMFAVLKNPILGDEKYRSEYKFEKGLASHFFAIDIPYKGKLLELKTPIPKHFLKMAK